MQTSLPGNSSNSETGSILVDAVVSILIFSTLGLAVLILLGAVFRAVAGLDSEFRTCLSTIDSAQKILFQNQ